MRKINGQWESVFDIMQALPDPSPISQDKDRLLKCSVTYKSFEAESAPLRFMTGPLHFISQLPMTKIVLLSLYLSIEVHFFVCIGE